MESVQTLIGTRFEKIISQMYPELRYIGDEENNVPDFEHKDFFLETKVAYCQPDFAIRLKEYQIENFRKLEIIKPVYYLIGFHNFQESTKRLAGLKIDTQKKILSKEMQILRLFIVHNLTIKRIWDKNNCFSKNEKHHYCTLRDSHLCQIIEDKEITRNGKKTNAREYYGTPPSKFEPYSFKLPEFNKAKGLEIGYILPKELEHVMNYFLGQKS